MTMTLRKLSILLALSGVLAPAALPSQASAQDVEVTGPLAGQPPVRNLRLYRKNRLALTPLVGLTLQEPYRRTILFGARADYHFTDWLGVGLWGGYGGVGIQTALTDEIVRQGVTTGRNQLSLPSRAGFANQLGSMNGAVTAQLTLVPFRGKVALFQRLFLDTDLYVFGGAGLAFVEERADFEASQCTGLSTSAARSACFIDSQNARASRVAFTPTFGVGLNAYFTDYMGLSVEWRALPFAWNRSGTDEAGDSAGNFPDGRIDSDDRFFYLNHMFTFGLIFFVPGDVEVSE